MRPTRFGPAGYPVGGDGRERPLVAVWTLLMVGLLVPPLAFVPAVPLVGYVVRVVDATARGAPAPQFLDTPVRLLREGVAGLVVVLAYLLGPLLALLVTVYGATTGIQGPDLSTGETLLLYGGGTAVLCLFLLGFYLVPAGMAAYASERRLRAAFERETVGPLAAHAAYFARWMAGAVTLGTLGAVASVTLQVDRAGSIVASLVLAYACLLAAHLWGLGVRRARER